GHVRGAFTGADRDRPGLFEAAEHGTLFLDEVGELSPAIQVKLLRVLEQSMVTRVGDVQPRPVRCRIVAATNRDLADGGFRRDLYFRLNGVSIEVPALRERPSEIRPLGEHFIRDSVRRHGARPPASVEPEFWTALEAHSWPGNVRELRNVVERAVVLADGGSLDRSKLPADQAPNRPTEATLPPLKSEVEELERRRIMDALAQCSGNQTRAATLLGISRRTLINRLDTYKVPRPRKR
ncbi:MAG: sigma 54-interacting transcriptional regulator, partial [Myxococcota bacterium]